MTASNPESAKADERRIAGEDDTTWKSRVQRIREEQTLLTLKQLGFDTDDINEAQADMIFLRKLRKTSETTQTKLIASVIGLIFTLVGAFGTLALQQLMGQK